jgi:ArsR family transcriptional regulator
MSKMGEVEIFKALSDPTRLKILDFIKNDEKCICEIIPHTGKSQPNVSQHLKIMKYAGIIKERKEGIRIMIKVSNNDIFEIINRVKNLEGNK